MRCGTEESNILMSLFGPVTTGGVFILLPSWAGRPGPHRPDQCRSEMIREAKENWNGADRSGQRESGLPGLLASCWSCTSLPPSSRCCCLRAVCVIPSGLGMRLSLYLISVLTARFAFPSFKLIFYREGWALFFLPPPPPLFFFFFFFLVCVCVCVHARKTEREREKRLRIFYCQASGP